MSQVALKRVCNLVTDPGPDEERPFVALEHLVGGTGSLIQNVELPQRSPAAGIAAIEPGDVLFGKLRPYLAKTLRANEPMFASTELLALRPEPEVDSRWLHYLVMSDRVVRWAVATSDGSKMPRTSWSALGEYRTPVPELRQQRAIADFLDAETARIDALIDKKRRLVGLLREQLASHIERAVWNGVHGTIPLMYLTPSHRQIMYGIVLPGPNVEDGVPIIKGGNVASGKLEPSQLAKTTRDIEANYVRSRVAGGDVLYAIRGGIGDVAIASPSIAGANITQDVARVAPRVDVDPRWIHYALESATTRADALGRVVGATVKGINIWDLKRVRVPDVDPAGMQSRADELSKIERSINEIQQRLDRQIELLTEHRQALITAAVTGQLEIPGAAA